jgi:protein SCO1/2
MSNTLVRDKTPVKNSAKGKLSNSGKGNGKSPAIPKKPMIAIGVGFALLFAALVAFTSNRPAVTPPSVGGPFQLTAHNGQTVTDKDLLGRPFLVFFGYTHCPDICHATLFEMSEILRALGPQAKIGALFVTVDPERDTPEILKDYLSNFDPRIIGLSGAREAVDSMLREYRIFSKRSPSDAGDYAVDHTTVVYLMNKDGRFVSSFNVGRKPSDAARDLERYL